MTRRPRGKKPVSDRAHPGRGNASSSGPNRPPAKQGSTGARPETPPKGRSQGQRRQFKRRPPAEGERVEFAHRSGPRLAPIRSDAPERKRPDTPERKRPAVAPDAPDAAEPPAAPEWPFAYDDIDDPILDDDSELGIGSRVVPPAMNLVFSEDEDEDEDATAGGFRGLGGSGGSNYRVAAPATELEMQASIQELEARLDGLIRQASEYAPEPEGVADLGEPRLLEVSRDIERSATETAETQVEEDQSVIEATRELLSSEYYRRQWGRLGLRRRAEHIDDFGLDPVYEQKLLPLLNFLFRRYFRCETRDIERVPSEGRCLVVANHSGTFPIDGLMLRTALRLQHPGHRDLRWLSEDFIFYLPFLGVLMNRLGAVRACQENAQRLLTNDALLAAFPEGTKGVKKLYHERYQLQRFGRGGYIRLCLTTRTPLIPCAIIGAEETNPLLFRLEQLPGLVGLPYLPVTPTFPWLGPAGLLPAPTKWKMLFGEPMEFEQYGPADANDHLLVARLSDQVQAAIRDMLEQALRERSGVWLG